MLTKLIGKEKGPVPPKNQIEVICPVCGAAQYEPRLVVTTHCRKCGEHLRIIGRRVLASSKLNPVPSAVFPAEITQRDRTPDQYPEPAQPPPASEPTALLPTTPVPEGELPLGFGNAMGIGDKPAPAKTAPLSPPTPSAPPQPGMVRTATGRWQLGRRTLPEKAPELDPPGPMTVSTFQKMKEQGYYRQQYFKDVECFSCPNKFKVGRSAKSTQCPACGVHICLEDVDINVASTQSILTRGDVLIRKNGNVSTGQIKCRDLKVYGMVSGQLECSGDLVFRTSGTIIGEIRCKRLIVEKGSDIRFHNVIYAEDVDLQARVEANIQCSGRVLIGALGWIHGDVTARSVSIEPGGQLDGAMNILRTTSSAQPMPPLQTAAGAGEEK